MTDQGLYCYKVMLFGLKNAGATYQRLVNRMFAEQIGRTMEVYVDDMLVKSKEACSHVKNLEETFKVLRRFRMKLNPEKCSFGVSSGKFLGYIVSARGIEANPAKIADLIKMKAPETVKQLQSLTGSIASLRRFISKSTDKCVPFFNVIKQKGKLHWTPDHQNAFQKILEVIAHPPTLSKPVEGEELLLYLALTQLAVSVALVREDGRVQKPVYFTSKRLTGAETRYPKLEKLAYALVVASRKLRPYFQAHTIRVLTDQPLRQVLHKPEASGRLLKWSIELS